MTPTTKISPSFTAGDWSELRSQLDEPMSKEAWRKACDMISERVTKRFLTPVQILMEHPDSTAHGFGFAMLALDCLLIDALQAFREGRTSGNEARSTKAFVDFLVQRPRFASDFVSKTLARAFVDSVRNGLLHDGETRAGWRVHRRSPHGRILEKVDDSWTLYRDQFHSALEAEFSDYLAELTSIEASDVRRRCLLRMDSLCGLLSEPKTLAYFAYGSNMDEEQMSIRAPSATRLGTAHLRDYRIVFNKRSVDGTGKANIIHDKQSGPGVWGVVSEMTKAELRALAEHEKGYFQKELLVSLGGETKQVVTFVAEPDSVCQLNPSFSYLAKILKGARSLPDEYQANLRSLSRVGSEDHSDSTS